ncbi:SHOCT domain-containing protein [Kitasatospora sp. NPDC001603]|uniref:SHOCT domain-containing protein n=1 Tax=Kitasatospora sp. NPDC001603 TaxID=3154388 RepID=UPI00331FBA71
MDNYPLLNIFWTMFELFLWILWFFLLFKIITDIFRSQDLSGWGRAGWLVLVILLPLIGVLVYVIARGTSMSKRDVAEARQNEAAFKAYIREAAAEAPGSGPPGAGAPGAPGATGSTGSTASAAAAGGRSHVDDLAKLADLKAGGAITEVEYQRAKEKLLA